MVIGLIAIASIPTVTGISFALNEQSKANTRREEERRMAKFNIDAYSEANSEKAKEVHGKRVVLRDNKVRNISQFLKFVY